MSKKFLLTFFFAILFTTVLLFSTMQVKASGGEAYNIVATPGEDAATEVGINWHSDVVGTVLEYTTAVDSGFSNKTQVAGECQALTYNADTDWSNTTSNRYVCSVYLENLTEATEYIYRIGKSTFSATYGFETAAGSGSFTALVFADSQVFGSAPAIKFNDIMNKALEEYPDASLSLGLGDQVEHGKQMEFWESYFFSADFFKKISVATVMGNHDYDDYTIQWHNSMYANPQNGVTAGQDDVYWFKYNNVLFISLNSNTSRTFADQALWLENILSTEVYQYSVVSIHVPMQGSGTYYTGVSSYFNKIFDKYGVDLVMSGDNHYYCRTNRVYNNKKTTSNIQGTYYLTMGNASGSGSNGPSTNNSALNVVSGPGSFMYGVLAVNEKFINVKGIAFNNTTFETDQFDSYNIPTRRSVEYTDPIDKTAFMNKLSIQGDVQNTSQAIASWTGAGLGYVKNIEIINGSGKVVSTVIPYSDIDPTKTITGLTADSEYTYTINVNFKDGTSQSKTINFDTNLQTGSLDDIEYIEMSSSTVFQWTNNVNTYAFSGLKTYIDGTYYNTLAVTEKQAKIANENLGESSVITIFGVVTGSNEEILLATIKLGVEEVDPVLTVNKSAVTLEEDKTETITATIDQEGYKVVWSTSDATVATVTDGVVKGIKAGTAIITATIEGTTIKQEITVTVEKKPAVKLAAPSISISDGILTISEVTGAVKYEVYEGTTLLTTVDKAGTVDLKDLGLAAGNHNITVKAIGDDVETTTSSSSSAVVYTVEDATEPEPQPEEPTGCGSSATFQLVAYLLGTCTLLYFVRKKFF
ncbi:MAG: metallophosphoesterase [Bacilli bacterium]|nr:metallophosphoesterase [Bacilli bacterium]